jgi:hypothetical protein
LSKREKNTSSCPENIIFCLSPYIKPTTFKFFFFFFITAPIRRFLFHKRKKSHLWENRFCIRKPTQCHTIRG